MASRPIEPLDDDDARRLIAVMQDALCAAAHDYEGLRNFTIALLIGCGMDVARAVAAVEDLKNGASGSTQLAPNRHPLH